MKEIIVKNYLSMSKDLIGCATTLTKPNEAVLFLEICRIKQSEVLAKKRDYCNEFDKNSIIKKSRISSENIINKNILDSNREIEKIISNGSFGFLTKDYNEITIIESLEYDPFYKEFNVVFNENNFMKYFINCLDSNFAKIPIEFFVGIKGIKTTLLLLIILKQQNQKYRFIYKQDLCWIWKNDILKYSNSTAKRDIIESIKQLEHIGIIRKYDKKNILVDNKFNLPILPFNCSVLKSEENIKPKIKNIKNNIQHVNNEFSESELNIYKGED